MTGLWVAMVLAAEPQPAGPVTAIRWARPFTLAAPEADPNQRGAEVTGGWLVELTADPALLIPTDYAEPWLYIGEQRALKLNWDYEADPASGGCLVAIVSGKPDLAKTNVFFGRAPKSSDPDRPALARAEAARLGVRPRPTAEVAAAVAAGGPALAAHDLRDVWAAGMARVGACTSTAADRQRAGVPPR